MTQMHIEPLTQEDRIDLGRELANLLSSRKHIIEGHKEQKKEMVNEIREIDKQISEISGRLRED